jgi:hypothetical protein
MDNRLWVSTALINELKVFSLWEVLVGGRRVVDGDPVIEDGEPGVRFHLGDHPWGDLIAAPREQRGGVVKGQGGVIAAQ